MRSVRHRSALRPTPRTFRAAGAFLAVLAAALLAGAPARAHPHAPDRIGARAFFDAWFHAVALEPARRDFGRERDARSDGWAWLVEGELEAALEVFAWDASAAPGRGDLKAGYAVTALLLGESERALWAFRRAFRRDAEGVGRVRLAPAVARRVRPALDRIRDPEQGPYERQAAAFVLAASHVLLGELETARAFADWLMQQGDPPPDVRALDRWLDRRVEPLARARP